MRLKDGLKYIATLAKVFTTVLILLIALLIIQSIIIEAVLTFSYKKTSPTITKSEAELTPEEQRLSRIIRSEKEFSPDGTIDLIYQPKRTPAREKESEIVQVYDANDNLLWEGPRNKKPYEYLSWAEQFNTSRYGVVFTQREMKQLQMITPVFSRNIEIPVGSDNKVKQVWRYYTAGEFFVGYDIDGSKIGYIGSSGFTDSKTNVKPFGDFRFFTAWCQQDSSSPTLLWQTKRHIYQIDFENRQVEPIFESPDTDIERIFLHGWRDLALSTKEYIDREKYQPLLYCETKDNKHHLIMHESKQQLTINMPEDWKNWVGNYYKFTATKQAVFMYRRWIETSHAPDYSKSPEIYQKWWQSFRSQPQKYWVELYKVDNHGNLELLNRYNWTVSGRPESETEFRDYRAVALRIVNKLSPPFYDFLVHLLGREKFWARALEYQNRGDFSYSLARMLLDIRPQGSIFNRLLSAVMMVFAFWHGWPRRTSWPKFLFWLAFVGIFNLAGLLTYLALNHTALIKCPACGKRRGLTQVNCIRCGEGLPAPERGKLDLIFNRA